MKQSFIMKNGMRVHLMPIAGTEAATFFVLVRVGSRYEVAKLQGAAHFIEHLMFKGTKRRPTTLDISRALDAVGAEYNAYTGKDVTGYYVKADARHLPLAIDLLHDMLFCSHYAKKELDRERRVIMEEINMYRDNPIMHIEDLLEETLFDGNVLGRSIAGTHETMQAMSRSDVIAFRDVHYVPSQMVLVAAGNIGKDARALIEKSFGSVPKEKEIPKPFEAFLARGAEAPRLRVCHKETEQIQLAFGFPSCALSDKRNAATTLLSIILGGSMSSRLFVAVRERKGLAYSVRAAHSPYEDVGAFSVVAGLDASRLPLAAKTILSEMKLMARRGVTARELREAKDHVRGRMLLRLEDSSDHAEWAGRQELFLGEVKTLDERMKEIEKVTRRQLLAVAKEVLDEKKMVVSVIGPYKDAEAFHKAAGI